MKRKLAARPRCYLCGRPVEEFTEEAHETGALSGRVTFEARCHGEVERITVRRSETRGMSYGQAFVQTKALPPIPLRGLSSEE